MNKRLLTTVMAAAGLAWGGGMASGAELALWNSANSTPLKESFEPAQKADGLSVANLARGNGLVYNSGSPAGNTFAARGYEKTSYAAALSAGDYWETTLDPAGNYLSLDTLECSFGGPKSGPKAWQWAFRVGTSGSWTALGAAHVSERTGSAYEFSTVDLSAIPLTDQPVGLRLVAWNGDSTATAWGNFGQATNVLVLTGSLESGGKAPMVKFTPATASVDAGNTVEITVSVLPAESEITSWSCSPTPAGTPTFSGGVFRYTAQAADALKWFTVTATARNAQGSTTASGSFFVNPETKPGTLTLTFDNERQPSWSGAGSVTIPAGSNLQWAMSKCMIGEDAAEEAGDQAYSGTGRALRFAYDESGSFESKVKIVALSKAGDTVQTNGVAKISFWYGIYKGDAGEESEHPVRPAIVTELSDDGKLWVEVGRVATEGTEEDMAEASFDVGVETPVYLRIRTEGVPGSSRVNVDQLRVVPQTTSKSSLNLFLLDYNVTPGDAQTGAGEDWDGDTKTNFQESRAETNPYDRESHP